MEGGRGGEGQHSNRSRLTCGGGERRGGTALQQEPPHLWMSAKSSSPGPTLPLAGNRWCMWWCVTCLAVLIRRAARGLAASR